MALKLLFVFMLLAVLPELVSPCPSLEVTPIAAVVPAGGSVTLSLALNDGASATICVPAPFWVVPAVVTGVGEAIVSVGAFVGFATITVNITDPVAVPSCNSSMVKSIPVYVDPPAVTSVVAGASCGAEQGSASLAPQNTSAVPWIHLASISTGCAAGYELVGLVCRLPRICPALAAPANGRTGTCVYSPVNKTCSFTCNSGNRVAGAPRTCSNSSAWSGTAQTCNTTSALSFGADSPNSGYVELAYQLTVTPRTLESWLKVDPAYTTERIGAVFGTYPAANNIGMEMYTNRIARLTWNNLYPFWNTQWHAEVDTWYHVAFVVTETTASLYVNGAHHSTITYGPGFPMVVPGAKYRYGNDHRAGGQQFHGVLDEGRLWSVSRSASEISANFATYLTPGTPGLLVYLSFDTGDASDSSGNMNNGTIILGAAGKPVIVTSENAPISG